MHSSGSGYDTGGGLPSWVAGRSEAAGPGPGPVQGATPTLPWPMTREQLEMLRRQIFVFNVISRRLADMFRATHQPEVNWTPTASQKEILERVFWLQDGFTLTPQRVKEITAAICGKGPNVHEASVLHWLQEHQSRVGKPETSEKKNSEENERNEERDEHADTDHPENWASGNKRHGETSASHQEGGEWPSSNKRHGEASASHQEGGEWPPSNRRRGKASASHQEGGEWPPSNRRRGKASPSHQDGGESATNSTESLLFQTSLLYVLTGSI